MYDDEKDESFKVGDITVEVCYADTEVTLQERMENMLGEMYG